MFFYLKNSGNRKYKKSKLLYYKCTYLGIKVIKDLINRIIGANLIYKTENNAQI